MALSKGVAYCKGIYLPIEEATVPILDPAFTKSDVVFDAISAWEGSFFKLDDHLNRFRNSCDYIRVTPPYTDQEISVVMAECVARSQLNHSIVYILCTRGCYAGGGATGDPRTAINEFMAYSVPYYWIVPKDRLQTGAHLWVADTRRAPDDAINQRVKNFNRMDLTRAQFEALDAGADAPILLSTDGFITEGPGFNLWVIRDGKALTPGENLLEGITRKSVFELCSEAGLSADTANLTPSDVEKGDEVFISSTGGGIIPVTQINGKIIANGAPGLKTCQLSDNYWKKRVEGWEATKISDLLHLNEERESLTG